MLKIIITYVIWEYSIYWAIKHCSEECEEAEKNEESTQQQTETTTDDYEQNVKLVP